MRRNGWSIFVAAAFLVAGLAATLLAPNAFAANKHCVCPPPPDTTSCYCSLTTQGKGNRLVCLVACDLDQCFYTEATCSTK